MATPRAILKLSDPQRRVLAAMAAGAEIWTISGLNAHALWHGNVNARVRAPSMSTVEALRWRGLIEVYRRHPAGPDYRISDFGRDTLAAIAKAEGRS